MNAIVQTLEGADSRLVRELGVNRTQTLRGVAHRHGALES